MRTPMSLRVPACRSSVTALPTALASSVSVPPESHNAWKLLRKNPSARL